MKNDIHQSPQVRNQGIPLAPNALVSDEVAQSNNARLAERGRRRRRINYVKKILNDDFLMNMQ